MADPLVCDSAAAGLPGCVDGLSPPTNDPSSLDAVQRHIHTFAASGLVDLSDRSLGSRPEGELSFASLREGAAAIQLLDLSSNGIASLAPRLLRPLVGLRDLSLAHNLLESLPATLCALPALTSLDLSHNRLHSLAVSAEALGTGAPALTHLDLSHNLLHELPPALRGCAALLRLDLSHNRLALAADTQAHATLLDASPLTHVSLAANGCLTLPAAVWRIPSLASLRLERNRLASLAPLAHAPWRRQIRALHLDENALDALPAALGECDALEQLTYEGNALAWPPQHVLRLPLPALLRWLRQHAASMPTASPPAVSEADAQLAQDGEGHGEEGGEEGEGGEEEDGETEREAAWAAEMHALTQRHAQCVASRDEMQRRSVPALQALNADADALRAAEARMVQRRAQISRQLASAEKAVVAASSAVVSIPDRYLQELRQLLEPPHCVRATLQGVHVMLEACDSSINGSAREDRAWPPAAGSISTQWRRATRAVRDHMAAQRLASTAELLSSDQCLSEHAAAVDPILEPLRTPRGADRLSERADGAPLVRHSVSRGGTRTISTLLPPVQSPRKAAAFAAPAPPLAASKPRIGTLVGWEAIRGMLRKDFVLRIQRFDAAQLPVGKCAQVRAVLPAGSNALARVTTGSKVAGPLYVWILAQLERAEAVHASAPLFAEMEHLDRQIVVMNAQKEASAVKVAYLRVELERLQVEAATLHRDVSLMTGDMPGRL